jgi:hypothetical protein
MAMIARRRARYRERQRHKIQLERVAAGLPAWTEHELDALVDAVDASPRYDD